MILVPELVWERLLDEFARTVPGVERVAYLDGIRTDEIGVVTMLTIPDADLYPGYFDVSAEAMSQAGTHLRHHELARLVQVHTHGLGGCHHSPRDDAMAYSQREGATSIVLPLHAARRPTPLDGVVHQRDEEHWRALDPGHAAEAVRIIPSILDFRSAKWTESPTATRAPSTGVWHRLMRLVRRPSQ